jgi:phage tail protein X
MIIYRAKKGERLDQICYRFYRQLNDVYLPFLEAQNQPLLSKGELDANDIVILPTIEIKENDTKGNPWDI